MSICSVYKNVSKQHRSVNRCSNKIGMHYLFDKHEYMSLPIIVYSLIANFISLFLINLCLKKQNCNTVVYSVTSLIPLLKSGNYNEIYHCHNSFDKLKQGKVSMFKIRRVIKRFERFVLLSSICSSDFNCHFKTDKGVYIPNFTHFNFECLTQEKHKRFVFVGRIDNKVKQIDKLVKSYCAISDFIPDWSLHIIGSGDDLPYLQEFVKKNNCENRIILAGHSNNVQLELQKCEVFCLTSAYEGMPLVLIEALFAGLPIITYDSSPGIKDIVEDGLNGYIVDMNDIEGFSQKMLLLANDAALRDKFSVKCNEIAKEKFDASKTINKWSRIL